jgi:hypothetical protein
VNGGRRLRAVRFFFSRNPQARLPLEDIDMRAEAARLKRLEREHQTSVTE